jgi:hypothetical protein
VREPVLPPTVPMPLDHELLAWAAGFFDGEGSTIAKSDSRRPDYFQLEISVSQLGAIGVPSVLMKFQRAMLGIGGINPQPDDMYKWCARGKMAVPLALALLWPWLGTVKRQQALTAMDVVERNAGERPTRPARYDPVLMAHAAGAIDPTGPNIELAWAAGFLDGEGYFGNPKRYERTDGTFGLCVRGSATQHGDVGIPAAVLERLRAALGGRIERHGKPDDFKWVVEGVVKVRRVLEAVRPWLGEVKAAQAEAALAAAEATRVRGTSERCKRGHAYDRVIERPDGSVDRSCTACARMADRAERAANGGKSRVVRNPPSDPTRVYRTKPSDSTDTFA